MQPGVGLAVVALVVLLDDRHRRRRRRLVGAGQRRVPEGGGAGHLVAVHQRVVLGGGEVVVAEAARAREDAQQLAGQGCGGGGELDAVAGLDRDALVEQAVVDGQVRQAQLVQPLAAFAVRLGIVGDAGQAHVLVAVGYAAAGEQRIGHLGVTLAPGDLAAVGVPDAQQRRRGLRVALAGLGDRPQRDRRAITNRREAGDRPVGYEAGAVLALQHEDAGVGAQGGQHVLHRHVALEHQRHAPARLAAEQLVVGIGAGRQRRVIDRHAHAPVRVLDPAGGQQAGVVGKDRQAGALVEGSRAAHHRGDLRQRALPGEARRHAHGRPAPAGQVVRIGHADRREGGQEPRVDRVGAAVVVRDFDRGRQRLVVHRHALHALVAVAVPAPQAHHQELAVVHQGVAQQRADAVFAEDHADRRAVGHQAHLLDIAAAGRLAGAGGAVQRIARGGAAGVGVRRREQHVGQLRARAHGVTSSRRRSHRPGFARLHSGSRSV